MRKYFYIAAWASAGAWILSVMYHPFYLAEIFTVGITCFFIAISLSIWYSYQVWLWNYHHKSEELSMFFGKFIGQVIALSIYGLIISAAILRNAEAAGTSLTILIITMVIGVIKITYDDIA